MGNQNVPWLSRRAAGPSASLEDDDFVGELTERKPLCGSRGALQVPPLRCASVGMTKGRAVNFIRGRQFGWTDGKQQVPHFASLCSGITKWRAVTFIGSRRIGWTEEKQQVHFASLRSHDKISFKT